MAPKQLWIFIGSVLLLGVGFLAYTYFQKTQISIPEGVQCTQEAKICPDGSAVGRIGSDCHFAACSGSNASSTAETGTLKASIGVSSEGYSVRITPLRVIEDSRCPMGVMCIQAGTVRLEAAVSVSGSIPETYTFILGNPIVVNGKSITFTEVTPVKNARSTIISSEYRFVFRIDSSDGLFDSKG